MLKSSYKLKWGSVQNSTTRPGSYVLLDLHNLHCTCTYRKQEHWIQFTGLDQKSGTSSQTETKQPQDNECIHSRFSTALAFYNKYFEFNSHMDMRHRVVHYAVIGPLLVYMCEYTYAHVSICIYVWIYIHMLTWDMCWVGTATMWNCSDPFWTKQLISPNQWLSCEPTIWLSWPLAGKDKKKSEIWKKEEAEGRRKKQKKRRKGWEKKGRSNSKQIQKERGWKKWLKSME